MGSGCGTAAGSKAYVADSAQHPGPAPALAPDPAAPNDSPVVPCYFNFQTEYFSCPSCYDSIPELEKCSLALTAARRVHKSVKITEAFCCNHCGCKLKLSMDDYYENILPTLQKEVTALQVSTVEDVLKVLRDADISDEVVEQFRSEKINGSLFFSLSDADLADMGITKSLQVKRVLLARSEAKEKMDAAISSLLEGRRILFFDGVFEGISEELSELVEPQYIYNFVDTECLTYLKEGFAELGKPFPTSRSEIIKLKINMLEKLMNQEQWLPLEKLIQRINAIFEDEGPKLKYLKAMGITASLVEKQVRLRFPKIKALYDEPRRRILDKAIAALKSSNTVGLGEQFRDELCCFGQELLGEAKNEALTYMKEFSIEAAKNIVPVALDILLMLI